MTNQIYIPNELTGPLLNFPKAQARVVKRTIDCLGEDVLGNSSFVSNDGPARGAAIKDMGKSADTPVARPSPAGT